MTRSPVSWPRPKSTSSRNWSAPATGSLSGTGAPVGLEVGIGIKLLAVGEDPAVDAALALGRVVEPDQGLECGDSGRSRS